MSLEETFQCYVGAYYGVREMDLYPLKEYVLHDLDIYIREFVKLNQMEKDVLIELSRYVEEEVSLKTKLQDALLVLPKIHVSLEFLLMIKERIRNISEEIV